MVEFQPHRVGWAMAVRCRGFRAECCHGYAATYTHSSTALDDPGLQHQLTTYQNRKHTGHIVFNFAFFWRPPCNSDQNMRLKHGWLGGCFVLFLLLLGYFFLQNISVTNSRLILSHAAIFNDTVGSHENISSIIFASEWNISCRQSFGLQTFTVQIVHLTGDSSWDY